jgi:hypothetical protein
MKSVGRKEEMSLLERVIESGSVSDVAVCFDIIQPTIIL